MLALVVSFNMADDQPTIIRDRIKVTVQYDPQGPNNWIVACVTFINENPYRVEVTGWPVITCARGKKAGVRLCSLQHESGGNLLGEYTEVSSMG